MKRKAVPIILTSVLLGLVFDWFFFDKLPGISVFLYASLILGYTFYLARQFKSALNKSIYWLTPVILFFALMVSVRANLFLAVMNIFLITYLLIMVVSLARQPKVGLQQYGILQYLNLAGRMPMGIIREFFQFLVRLLSKRNVATPKSSLVPIVRGLIISLPILVLLMILLSSADLVFKEFIDSLFSPNISPETIFRLFLIGFVASLFIGAFALIFMPSAEPETDPAQDKNRFDLGATESSVVLGSVCSLFLVFVIIQFAYLFGGAGQVASTGHTYAEYARKGFFELIAVAAISLLLILAVKNATKFRTSLQTRVFKWLSGILVVEVMVIMISAHMRLNLYEETYGFTMLRLLSHLFILWLASAFVMLPLHIISGKNQKNLALQLFVSVLCFFALTNIINPDNFIVRQNIARYKETGKLDVHYLSNLSEDAVPAVAGLLDSSDQDLRKSAAYVLYQLRQFAVNERDNWQSANLARHHADQIFSDKATQIESGKSYDDYRELDIR